MESARIPRKQSDRESVAGRTQKERIPVATGLRQPSPGGPPGLRLAHTITPSHSSLTLPVQAKLTVSTPGDRYEQEADRAAQQVMRMADPAIRLHPKPQVSGFSTATEQLEKPGNQPVHLRRRAVPGNSPATAEAPAIVHETLRSPGQPLGTQTRNFFEGRYKQDFGHVRVHTGAQAAASARAVNAMAYTLGPNLVFGAGRYAPETKEGSNLLAHELAHVAQTPRDIRLDAARAFEIARPDHAAERDADRLAEIGGSPFYRTRRPMIFRSVVPRPVARLTADQIFGVVPASGLSLSEFRAYTREEADWFVEPTLAAGTQRDDLWRLLLTAEEGAHILSGVGDVKISELRGVSLADWTPLRAFCRGTHSSGHTVRIFPPLPALADRILLGQTLLDLEALIPPAVLEVTVSHNQLVQLQTQALLPILRTYWTDYQPHIQQTFAPAPGARGPEFERILVFLNSLGAPGLAPLLPLKGAGAGVRWVRNLHRFPLPMLQRLVANLLDTSGTKRLILVLHTGHDAPGAFQISASLFSDLVLTSPNNLVLMIEGAVSLAAITARVPIITSTWGELVGGTRRISQVLIAGHGSAQSAGMAGTGAPSVTRQGLVHYNEESLDIRTPAAQATTQALLDALLTNMPPAAARVLYAGCLVGSTHVPRGTAGAAIPGALAAHQSLGAFTEARAGAAGVAPGRVQAARASVGLGSATSLFDPLTGELRIAYPFDPNAFGSASTYAATGVEPEGVLRAAVEVGATNVVTAETLLRTRLAMAPAPDWYDTVTRLLVRIALPVAVGSGVNLERVNELANVAQIPFLALWPQFNIGVSHFTIRVNPQAFALDIYNGVAATAVYSNPPAHSTQRMRIIIDQGWLAKVGVGHVPTFLAGILATGLSANAFRLFLETAVIGPHAAILLPGGAPSVAQIRLALAWFFQDPANVQVRSFLTGQVLQPPNLPAAFTPAVSAEVLAAGRTDREILDELGFGQTAMAPAIGGGAAQPFANLALPGSPTRTLLVTGRPYVATVTASPTTVARRDPTRADSGFSAFSTGATVRVTGFSGGWAAVDVFGQLGFIRQGDLTPP